MATGLPRMGVLGDMAEPTLASGCGPIAKLHPGPCQHRLRCALGSPRGQESQASLPRVLPGRPACLEHPGSGSCPAL